MTQTIPLSVLIRTFNEADRVARTLESARALGGEIVVIDAGSTDETVSIAKSYGAKVITNPWPGFGPQRFFGEDQCTHHFVFSLDADEVLTPEIIAAIRDLFSRANPPPLMIVRKALVFPDRHKPTPWAFCHEQILIYDRRVARTGSNPNWDALDISTASKPHRIMPPLWHFTFRNWTHAFNKANYVAKLAGETQKPRSPVYLGVRMFWEFPATFFKFYFVRRYCLGGRAGLIMALVSAYGRFIRVAMMFEGSLRDTSSKNPDTRA